MLQVGFVKRGGALIVLRAEHLGGRQAGVHVGHGGLVLLIQCTLMI